MATTKPRRTFSKEYKLDVIQQSYRCDNIKALALELGIRPELVYRWRAAYKEDPEVSFPGQGTPKQTSEEKDLAELKRKLTDVKTERDILKKAIGIFSSRPK